MGFFRWPEEMKRYCPTLGEVGAVFFAYLLVQLFVAAALVQLVYGLMGVPSSQVFADPQARLWVLIAGGFLGLAFVLPFSWRSTPSSSQIWVWGPQSKGESPRNFGLGVLSWLIVFPLVVLVNHGLESLIGLLTGNPPLEQVAVGMIKKTNASTLQVVLVAFSVAVLIPIVEEILFRGFFQSYLRRKLGVVWAVVLTALFFSLFHFSIDQSWSNVVILSSLFILGLFLGYLYERQRSLWAPIGLHMAFNAISLSYIFLDKG